MENVRFEKPGDKSLYILQYTFMLCIRSIEVCKEADTAQVKMPKGLFPGLLNNKS